ncbi:hypothetical protein QQP08_010144 [Theobroma cacao]|nr:hypothetical protein QQP08_010144 [Theobroma cacao]
MRDFVITMHSNRACNSISRGGQWSVGSGQRPRKLPSNRKRGEAQESELGCFGKKEKGIARTLSFRILEKCTLSSPFLFSRPPNSRSPEQSRAELQFLISLHIKLLLHPKICSLRGWASACSMTF